MTTDGFDRAADCNWLRLAEAQRRFYLDQVVGHFPRCVTRSEKWVQGLAKAYALDRPPWLERNASGLGLVAIEQLAAG
jgi:hypothetical protein